MDHDFNLASTAIPNCLVVTGDHPVLGPFVVVVEHDGGEPTFTTVVLDGVPNPIGVLGPEVTREVADFAVKALVRQGGELVA